jgi:hypothetical protein
VPKTLIDVTEAAQEFLKTSGYVFTYLDKIQLDSDKRRWNLTFNVGVATLKTKTVVVDDETGKVVAFE